MNTVKQVMTALKKKGNPQRQQLYQRHGAKDRLYGVSVADMKTIARTIKGKQELAGELYDTGNYDAMYLAAMVADGRQMAKRQLQSWARAADWQLVSEYAVPWVASESAHARDLALKWIDARKEHVAACGWSTYGGIVTTTADEDLDLAEIKSLLKRIEDEIDSVANRVRYTMNGFVIAVGAYVKPLTRQAKATARKLGQVDVDMGGTSCKVPVALEYIGKIEAMGRAGKKRKTIRC
ncbi:MAG: DNA alkylation repair protein [bacterium]|nr:DNA alkylation repair protein [bacterium]